MSSPESKNNIETMEQANREDSTQGDQEKLEPTDVPHQDMRKEDLEAKVGTPQGEDHTGENLKEPETTSPSTPEGKKDEPQAEAEGRADQGKGHTGKNPSEPETTPPSTPENKKDEPQAEAEGRADQGEDYTGENLKEPETTSPSTPEDKKDEPQAEAESRADQGKDHTGENPEEPEKTPPSTLEDKKDEPQADRGEGHTGKNPSEPTTTSPSTPEDKEESTPESLGSTQHIGAGDGETLQSTARLRKPQPKDERKKDIENIGPTTQTTEATMTPCSSSHRGTLIGLMIILLGLALFSFLFTFNQSDSPPERDDVSVKFSRQMDKVQNQFRNQEPEFWRRTRIHLQRHLQTAQPTEPVSLILTAGLRAEKTLDCLARRLASAFSSAFNSSFLHIDGASKASQDSDQVKLDIDSRLQKAFDGGKPAAVIHRFEELPPGSTLIFYRYCDHENAAYKETFLIFTVLLEEEEDITANIRLSALEEMVDDYLKKRFLSDSSPVSYDRMDLDKYGGLWSRISHLILPVAADERIEHAGCQGT